MAFAIKNWLLTPLVWLISAGLFFACAIGLGYYQDQKIAVEAMAKPRGPAPLVAIQNFDSAAHSNIAGDVRLVAEVDFARVYEVEVGPVDAREAAILIPLYPLSNAGWQAFRREAEGKTTPRPVLREDRTGFLPPPVGAIFSRIPHSVASNLQLDAHVARRIGAGTSGTVVEISGVERSGLATDAGVVPLRGAFPMQMSADAVIVEPFEFERTLALADTSNGSERLVLTRIGLALLFIAALIAVRPISPPRSQQKPKPVNHTPERRRVSSHRSFQEIATQDEIFVAENEAENARRRANRSQTWKYAKAIKSRL